MSGPTIEHENYRLVAELDEELDRDDGPSSYVTHINVKITQAHRLVGEGAALLLHIGSADDDGVDVSSVFDCVDDDLHELYDAMFDHGAQDLRAGIVNRRLGADVLYFRELKIVPEHRGCRLGLRMVQRVRDSLGGGCAVLALAARPLVFDPTFERELDAEVFAKPFPALGEAARAKLRNYWSRLGFQRVCETDFMVFDMGARRLRIRNDDEG